MTTVTGHTNDVASSWAPYIRIAENNVHGGAKYMDRLMTKFFRTRNSTR